MSRSFADLKLALPFQEALAESGFVTPTDIQSMAIPPILAGKDVVVQSGPGAGTTTAFVLSLLSRIDPAHVQPQILVLVPTQEAAMHAVAAFSRFGKAISGLQLATIHGGQSLGAQIAQLQAGPHVVVGTATRLADHLQRGLLDLDCVLSIVLDEADTMLEMGYSEGIRSIFDHLRTPRQTLLVSADMPNEVQQFVDQFLKDPVHIRNADDATIARPVRHHACAAKPQSKLGTLTQILDFEPTEKVILLVKSDEMSTQLAETLCLRGYDVSALNGHLQETERALAVKRFQAADVGILVATANAVTELEEGPVSHVIHYDFPDDVEQHVERIANVERASQVGQVILLVTPREKERLRTLERVLGQEVPWIEMPLPPTIDSRRVAKLWNELQKTLRDEDLTESAAIASAYLEKNPDVGAERLAAALTFLAMTRKPENADSVPRKSEGSRRPRTTTAFKNRTPTRGRDRSVASGKRRERDAPRRAVGGRSTAGSMVKYRIEVGHAHGVKPGNIVGAIAHESGIRGSDIGGIDIQTHFSTVDLPEGLSQEQLQALSQLRVAGQQLRLSKWNRGGNERLTEQPREFRKRKYGKPSWKK